MHCVWSNQSSEGKSDSEVTVRWSQVKLNKVEFVFLHFFVLNFTFTAERWKASLNMVVIHDLSKCPALLK